MATPLWCNSYRSITYLPIILSIYYLSTTHLKAHVAASLLARRHPQGRARSALHLQRHQIVGLPLAPRAVASSRHVAAGRVGRVRAAGVAVVAVMAGGALAAVHHHLHVQLAQVLLQVCAARVVMRRRGRLVFV